MSFYVNYVFPFRSDNARKILDKTSDEGVRNKLIFGMHRFWKYKLDHGLFWLGTVGFHAFTRTGLIDRAGAGQFLMEIAVRNALLAVVIYVNLFVLVPRFARTKKYAAYVFLVLLSLVVYIAIKNAHDVYLYGYVIGEEEYRKFFHNTFYNLSIALFYIAFSVTLYLSKEWYVQQDIIKKIQIEKLNTELNYLKAQMNPHFLFNSINTIYFQIERQNTMARETLLTFSEMLRYQLYECNENEIAVEKEIQYLRNYTGLQRLRTDENYTIAFDCGDDVANFKIAPLLLMPFVENAFKHVSHASLNEIRIRLTFAGNQFGLNVFNTREEGASAPGGIGLKNVRRRLELLYPGRHALVIRETTDSFEVDLRMEVGLPTFQSSNLSILQ